MYPLQLHGGSTAALRISPDLAQAATSRGGFEGGVVDLLNNLSKAARAKTPPGQEPPWSARHFVPYWSQLLAREVQLGVADEIIARVHEKAAEIEAGNGRGA